MSLHLMALITGEMAVNNIPLAFGVDLPRLLKEDPDPCQIAVEIPEGKSTRGWYYTSKALQDIVDWVEKNTLAGFLGHQQVNNIDHEFLPPVVHWIGAKFENGKAYFRGLIDKAQPDLKRWIRTGRIKEVSIFGNPELKTGPKGTEVIGYHPLSIDFTPLGRAGMPTKIVDISGEMDSTFGIQNDFNQYEKQGILVKRVNIYTGEMYSVNDNTENQYDNELVKIRKVSI